MPRGLFEFAKSTAKYRDARGAFQGRKQKREGATGSRREREQKRWVK
jgi:hypothetical protein